MELDRLIAPELVAQLHSRSEGSSICPSEVARALFDEWRDLMPKIRKVSDQLAHQGVLTIQAAGTPVASAEAHRGPIRIARGAQFPHSDS